jgi:hypothetical protein
MSVWVLRWQLGRAESKHGHLVRGVVYGCETGRILTRGNNRDTKRGAGCGIDRKLADEFASLGEFDDFAVLGLGRSSNGRSVAIAGEEVPVRCKRQPRSEKVGRNSLDRIATNDERFRLMSSGKGVHG